MDAVLTVRRALEMFLEGLLAEVNQLYKEGALVPGRHGKPELVVCSPLCRCSQICWVQAGWWHILVVEASTAPIGVRVYPEWTIQSFFILPVAPEFPVPNETMYGFLILQQELGFGD